MLKTTLPAYLCLCLLAATPAQALTDYFSTAPGQGAADTLDDVWQSLFNGWGLVPGNDEDLDGCSNYVESIAGTDPRKVGDCLKVGNMVVSGSTLIFYFDAEAGKKYRVVTADSPAATTWNLIAGSEKLPTVDSANESIVIAKPVGDRKFYKLETLDADTDNDGVSDWAEREMGTDVASGSSASNASGGAASDADTLRSLLTLTASPGSTTEAYEKEGTAATVKVERSFGTMPLTVQVAGAAGATDVTKASAASGDYLFKNMAGVATNTVVIPAGQGTPGNPVEVVKVAPVLDATDEVPEAVKVSFILPNTPPGTVGPSATVMVKDSNPGDPDNRQLYVAFLGREAGVSSTASGYATALVNGDNDAASISLVFNNLSSQQNTAYIRFGNDLEVRVLPLGQVAGANWTIRAAQTVISDQEMLDALRSGQLYVSITTANYPSKEIFGYFRKTTGSTEFDSNNDDLLAPGLGSADWQNPTGEALSRDIYRFLAQCTFGGTTALHDDILNNYVTPAITGGGTYIDGLRNWLNVQMDPGQTPTVDFSTLVIAADNEEFVMRGNRPLHYNADPQYPTNLYSVTYDANSGMPTIGTTANTTQISNNYPNSAINRRREWWSLILQCKDQVRQRMAMALSEILVISEADQTINDRHYGCAEYWDMLAAGAFDKYRPLLEQVTYNPMMGSYLSHVGNRAAYDAGGGLMVSPDENYAREIMQLFSIGLVLRHPDGSLVLSGDGLPIATYDNTDITELARVMTGWSHGARHTAATVQTWNGDTVSFSNSQQRVSPVLELNASTATWFGIPDGGGHRFFQQSWMQPMKILGRATIGVATTVHDFGTYTDPGTGQVVAGVSKRLLAGKHGQFDIPIRTWTTDAQAHTAAAADVNDAHNSLAGSAASSTYGDGSQGNPGHQNTPINISRWLIQRLTSSNPSAGYVYRVQQVYRSTNGDLGDVMKAILLDYEARSLQLADTSTSVGKIKEPMIHFASVLRSLKAFSGAPLSLLRDNPPPFSASETMLAAAYPGSELSKFDTTQANPPSLPTGWATGPFRYRFGDTTASLGQSPQRAPSVFNWFLPDYTVPGPLAQAGLFAPELQISTESSEVARINYHWSVTWGNLVGMNAQPGTDSNISDFTLSNAFATPTARFSAATLTFTDANWNVPQNVTITANNDGLLTGLQNGNLQFSLGGTTSTYNGVTVQPLAISVQDNELTNEGLRVVQTGGSTWVQEGGKTDTFNVMLTAPPMSGVTVAVNLTTGSQVSLSSNTLNFNSGNWNVEQTVTVTAVNDATTEAAGATDTIAFTTSSTAANYNGLTASSITANIVDNDDGASSYGVLITESGAGTTVTESTATSGGDLDTYTIVLTKQPSATVTVTITCNTHAQVNTTGTTYATSTTRTFSTSTGVAGGWNVPQTITLRGVSDTTAEGTHAGTVTHTVATAGGYTAGMAIQGINVDVLDRNDTNGNRLMLAHSGNETRVGEGTGALTDTITVRLRTLPTANVSVNLGSNQVACSPAVLTFTTANWSSPQTVTVSAIDDYLNEGLHSANIIAYSYSTDTNYLNYGSTNSNLGALLTTAIIDNDQGRVLITESGGSTVISEGGATDTYTLALSSQPTAPVTIALQPNAQVTTTPVGPIVFDSTNWNTPVTVTVSAVFDTTAETTLPAQITHYVTSGDMRYHGITTSVVSPAVSDNELPLTIAQTNGFTTVAEVGTAGTSGTPNVSDTFTVALPLAPISGNTVVVTPVTDGQVTVSPASLTFTSSNSGTAQTFTVTAADDGTAEATPHLSTLAFNLSSNDAYYSGKAAQPIVVAVHDNDGPGVSIVESSGNTASTEGSTDTYTLVLTSAPLSNVVVRVSCDAQTEALITGSTYGTTRDFTFTSANWNVAQTVTVRPINDTVAELRHLGYISHSIVAASSADAYDAVIIPQVLHIITDNDNTVAANKVQITEVGSTSTTVTEAGGSDTYTVLLSQAPTSDVVVTITPNSQLMVSPATLTFTSVNFGTSQTVTVRAVDDSTVDSSPHYGGLPAANPHYGTITHTAASADSVYQGIAIAPITASITDNDTPGVIVTPSGDSTNLAEASGTDTYTVALSHEPKANVTVTLTANAQLNYNGTSALTFTPSAGATPWNVPQIVTLSAVDDATTENTHTAVVAHTVASTDRFYHGIGAPTVSASIVDNDGPQVTISHTSGNTVVTEGGATDTISIVLTQAPAAGTTLTVNLIPPAVIVPVPVYSKQVGYFTSDIGGNQNRERIVMDYTEIILLYRTTFYASLSTQYGGVIPTTPGNTQVQNAHWAATKAIVDRMDLWWCGGGLKAENPVLIEPNQTAPVPLPAVNARQTIMDALYYLSGGTNSPSTTRYLAEVTYTPKAPPTGTFHDEVRDRARYAAYLISSVAPSIVAH